MLIPPEEQKLYFDLYPSLLGYAAGRAGGIKGISDLATFRASTNEIRAQARDYLLENIYLLREYLDENPDEFRERDLSYMMHWDLFFKGDFIVERDLKKYTVFLSKDAPVRAYGVLSLSEEVVDMLPYPLPMMIRAVLLPWKGRIVCDGLFTFYSVHFGRGIRNSFRESYCQAKEAGIITSLEPGAEPEKPKPAKKPKTPAIERFLKKKCPKTVAEFKEMFGEPRMDMANDAARRYGPWNLDGTPSFDVDYLMLYANIIRHQVLYVYAKEEIITHISVVDPTQWRKQNFKPKPGQRLMS